MWNHVVALVLFLSLIALGHAQGRNLGVVLQMDSGNCEASGNCFSSVNYMNIESCTFIMGESGTLDVVSFDTEHGYDVLTVGGTQYHGSYGPQGVSVNAGEEISWYSDGDTGGAGFRICVVNDDPGGVMNDDPDGGPNEEWAPETGWGSKYRYLTWFGNQDRSCFQNTDYYEANYGYGCEECTGSCTVDSDCIGHDFEDDFRTVCSVVDPEKPETYYGCDTSGPYADFSDSNTERRYCVLYKDPGLREFMYAAQWLLMTMGPIALFYLCCRFRCSCDGSRHNVKVHPKAPSAEANVNRQTVLEGNKYVSKTHPPDGTGRWVMTLFVLSTATLFDVSGSIRRRGPVHSSARLAVARRCPKPARPVK